MGPLRKRPRERLGGVKGSSSLNRSGSSMGTFPASFTSMFIFSFSYSSFLAYHALVVSPFALALALICRLETFVEKPESDHSPEDYAS
ncbi:hypothetical protein QYF36_025148 [Acer negundo]|nr:hypothetical protein QYF36_025148 [Acer negundo]